MALLVVTSLVERGGLHVADVFGLDHGDPDARPCDDEVGPPVLPAVAEAEVAGDRRIVGQLVAERLHERLVGRLRELRSVREQLSRHVRPIERGNAPARRPADDSDAPDSP